MNDVLHSRDGVTTTERGHEVGSAEKTAALLTESADRSWNLCCAFCYVGFFPMAVGGGLGQSARSTLSYDKSLGFAPEPGEILHG